MKARHAAWAAAILALALFPLFGGKFGVDLVTKMMVFAIFALSLELLVGQVVLVDLAKATPFYYFVLATLGAVFVALAVLLRSRFGRALAGIRVNEQRMRAAGFSTYPYKLAAFVISGMVAGVAGFLFAVKDGFVNPELMSWHVSGTALMMIILGGIGSLHGAVLGAFAFSLLQELFKSEAIFGEFARHWHLGVGLVIILAVALLPRGLAGAS